MSGSTSNGVKTNGRGTPLLLQDSRAASNTFGFNQLHFLAVPKPKFLFYVEFKKIGATSANSSPIPNISSPSQDTSSSIGFIIKTMERPKVTFDTDVLNQYNKKRVIQKRIEYKPVNIKFHDTVDNRVYKLFQDYFQHYYSDSKHSQVLDWTSDTIAPDFKGSTTGWGFTSNNLSAQYTNFFDYISVYQVYGGNYNQFNLLNPKIISFDPDELDYNGSTVTHEIAMTLAYEGIVYLDQQTLSSNPALIKKLKLDTDNYYEPENGPISSNEFVNNSNDPNLSSINNTPNFSSNTVSQVQSFLTNPQSVNIGGILSGNMNSSNPISQFATSKLGQLGSTSSYNPLNTGTVNNTLVSGSSPDLRGLSSLNLSDPGSSFTTGGLF